MGEGFQFSSPYKWRCSKRFYRLFVYCSWLLIARDNSTGFTVQWGGVQINDGGTVTFPKTFKNARSITAALNNSERPININSLSNSSFTCDLYGTISGFVRWIAVGFSQTRDNSTGFTIVWGSASAGGGVWTTFARNFSSVLSVAFAPWDSGNYSWGNKLNNSGFSHHSSGNCKYIAVGFS